MRARGTRQRAYPDWKGILPAGSVYFARRERIEVDTFLGVKGDQREAQRRALTLNSIVDVLGSETKRQSPSVDLTSGWGDRFRSTRFAHSQRSNAAQQSQTWCRISWSRYATRPRLSGSSELALLHYSGDTGILRVGATSMVIENTLSGFLDHWRSRHPTVEVQLIEDGGIALPRRLGHGEIHLGIMAVDETRFRFRLLYPVHGLAVVTHKHRFGRNRTIDVTDLTDEPLMLLRGEYASRDWFETACKVARIQPRVLLECGSPHASIALAAIGYGVAVVPSTVLLPRERVRGIPLTQRGAAIGRWLRLVWEPQRFLAAYAEAFVTDLVDYCRRNYPGHEFSRRAPQLPRPRESVG